VGGEGLHAEQRARRLIDAQLTAAGWQVCDLAQLDLIHYPNCAVREVRMKKGSGQVDYLLYVDRRIVGVIEAKPTGTPLSGVKWQSSMYAEGLSAAQRLQAVTVADRLPFVFEASGSETHFTNGYDPQPRARKLFAFPQPAQELV
jgi:type I restriction enzyme R subunit